ncbi:MAG: hypothetical protein Q8K85_06330, partial [Hyphomicrobium sp.]|nr:hypothetical protein [Hyphomicrobium sp.]
GALALSYSNAIAFESPERVEGFAELRDEAVRQARRLDPGNADAAAATLPIHYFGRWAQCERLYRGLLRRHPDHSPIHHRLGMLLMDVGRWVEAVGSLAAAKSGNPLSPIIRYRFTVALWSAGLISEAEREIDQALDQWPQHGAIWQTKVKLLGLTGRPRMALAFMQDPARRPLEEVGETMRIRALLLTALASETRADVAAAVDAMLATVRAIPSSGMSAAINCARLGEVEIAEDILDGTLLGTGSWAHLRASSALVPPQTHPLFQPHASRLWPRPRFAALLSRIGLERHWAWTEKRPDFRRPG